MCTLDCLEGWHFLGENATQLPWLRGRAILEPLRPRRCAGSGLGRSLEGEVVGRDPGEAEQQHNCNYGLGDGAVETPDFKRVLLDHGKPEGEEEAGERGKQIDEAPACEGQAGQHQVAGDSDGGDRDMIDEREAAVVYDAAVPVLVD